ncbi:MAG: T9SS type A sorting domain-containing protein [Ignavibacteria bacterium]
MGKRFFYSTVIFSLICVTPKVSAQWEKILDAGRTILAFDNVILVGSDSGCYRSLDYGENWTFHIVDTLHVTMPYPQEVLLGIGRLCKNDKYIFAATGASIYSSGDTGRTWNPIGPFPEGRPLGMNNVFAKDSIVLATMFGGGFFRSTDNGATWPLYIPGFRCFDYIVHEDLLFVAAQFEGVMYSEDWGLTWYMCEGWPFMKFAAYSTRNNKYFFVCTGDELFRSSDFGDSWHLLDISIEKEGFQFGDVLAADSLIFLSILDDKVYVSKNNGDTWSEMNEGLDTIGMGDYFSLSSNYLIMSKNNSVWRYDFSQITKIRQNQSSIYDFILFQNHPNPFNPITHFGFRIANFGFVSLKIYDLLGNEVAVLVNEEKPAGIYKIKFDGSSLSSGVYFYTISTGNLKQSKKMILAK